VRNCIDRVTDDLSPTELCRRAINGEVDGDRVSDLLERCREHIGDATNHNPAEMCRRAINGELDGDRVSDLLERHREHFGDAGGQSRFHDHALVVAPCVSSPALRTPQPALSPSGRAASRSRPPVSRSSRKSRRAG
jgi:hypothetical protein